MRNKRATNNHSYIPLFNRHSPINQYLPHVGARTKSVACDTLRARRVLPKATIYLSRRDASLAERFLYNRERSFLLYKKRVSACTDTLPYVY